MIDTTRYRGLESAIKVKKAIEDVEQRAFPSNTARQKARSLGTGSSSANPTIYLPLYDQTGTPFAEEHIHSPGYVLAMPDIPPQNTIIQFTNDHGYTAYGLVTYLTKSWRNAIFVRTINHDYYLQLKTENPNLPLISLTTADLQHLLYKNTTTTIPTQKTFFGFYKSTTVHLTDILLGSGIFLTIVTLIILIIMFY